MKRRPLTPSEWMLVVVLASLLAIAVGFTYGLWLSHR